MEREDPAWEERSILIFEKRREMEEMKMDSLEQMEFERPIRI